MLGVAGYIVAVPHTTSLSLVPRPSTELADAPSIKRVAESKASLTLPMRSLRQSSSETRLYSMAVISAIIITVIHGTFTRN